MLLILLVILILLSLGSLPTWPHSRSWGYYPSGGLGLVVIILVVLLLLGRLGHGLVHAPARGTARGAVHVAFGAEVVLAEVGLQAGVILVDPALHPRKQVHLVVNPARVDEVRVPQGAGRLISICRSR